MLAKESGVIEINQIGYPLGVITRKFIYKTEQIQLAPGDALIIYSDGIVEALNEKKEMFSFGRLGKLLQLTRHLTPAEIGNEILRDLRKHHNSSEFEDDVTMIILKRKATSPCLA
ncbi:MAG: serine/threonine-protein phosphatase, partial [Candidatus Riflebacteria bacterium]|nr:serine/threonine-protein phosphatase [Candidatus Riflebacteria bacterium]